MARYDVIIIGAGIAGSSLAILLADQGKKVLLVEKNKLPHHKVCGEFISLESYPFFKSLGLPLDDWDLPIIKKLRLTSQKGTTLVSNMDTGGFGISRYKLDLALLLQAKKSGAEVHYGTKVTQATSSTVIINEEVHTADLVIGTFGKYKPHFLAKKKGSMKNYIGVKYHIKGDFDSSEIALHSFEGGYCGMSQIEDNAFCLCYLIDSEQLRQNGNDIQQLEKNVLSKNSALKSIFKTAQFLWEKPLVISNIKFDKQTLAENGILFCGDAAGSISPLSGNGMSIAAKSALLLSQLIIDTDQKELLTNYELTWDKHFASKINKAKWLNQIMLHPTSHDVVLRMLKIVKPLRTKVINEMQGKPFVRTTTFNR